MDVETILKNTSQPDTNTGKEITIAIYRDGDMNELDAASYNGPSRNL